jgi:hypothetical protein
MPPPWSGARLAPAVVVHQAGNHASAWVIGGSIVGIVLTFVVLVAVVAWLAGPGGSDGLEGGDGGSGGGGGGGPPPEPPPGPSWWPDFEREFADYVARRARSSVPALRARGRG